MVQTMDSATPKYALASTSILLVLGCSALGCSDQRPAKGWTFDGSTEKSDIGSTADGFTPSADVETRDTSQLSDTSSDTKRDPDGSSNYVEVSGVYRTGFEASAFVPGGDIVGPLGTGCSFRTSDGPREEQWWGQGLGSEAVLGIRSSGMTPGTGIGLVSAKGTITERGRYGHLGGYDRRFTAESHQLHVCKTFRALGRCALPGEGHRCFEGINRTTDQKPEIIVERHVPGPVDPKGRQRYTLEYRFDQRVADGGKTVIVEVTLPDEPSTTGSKFEEWRLRDAENLSVTKRCGWIGGVHKISYDSAGVSGWLRRTSKSGGTSEPPLRLYLRTGAGTRQDKGKPCSNGPLTLWGHFQVDRVVGHP